MTALISIGVVNNQWMELITKISLLDGKVL